MLMLGTGAGTLDPKPEIAYLRVPERKHRGEGIVLIVALALLFILLVLMVGHPKPPPPSSDVGPAHSSALQIPR